MGNHKASYYLVVFSIALAICVVVLGAYTRLKDAGLGCPDWPGCYGFLSVPSSIEEINQAQALYPEAPFESDKAWPEVIHRYFATGLGFIIILVNILAWKNRHIPNQPIKLPIFLLVLVIAQGMFGMWTVTLKLWPQVVTTHLLGGFTTLSLLWLLGLRLRKQSNIESKTTCTKLNNLRPLAIIGLFLVIIQIALGGWISSNYAALACPDLPTCQNQWWPSMDFGNGFNLAQKIGPNYLGGQLDGAARVAIHFTHRLGAIVVSLYFVFLLSKLYNIKENKSLRCLTNCISILFITQVCLGISNIIWMLPLGIAVAHNAGGALLLLSMVTLNYRIYQNRI